MRVIEQSDGRFVSIEYATRRYVVSQMGQLSKAVADINHDKIGADGWEISAHAAPAEDHAPYQGHQYTDKQFEEIQSSLARPFGMWFCTHTLYPVKIGRDKPVHTDARLQEYLDADERGVTYDGKHYTLREAKDCRTELESMARRQKNKVLAEEALGDADKLQNEQIKLNRINQEYVRFCHGTGQKTRGERLQVAGFGHGEAARVQRAAKYERVKKSMTAQLQQLTQAQKEAITRYTGAEATTINYAIGHNRLTDEIRNKIKILDEALEHGVVPETITVYRNTSISFLQLSNEKKPSLSSLNDIKGTEINTSIFMSTSFRNLDLNARDTVLVLKVPKGYEGALYIRDLAIPKYKSQDEVLFGRGLRYIIKAIDIVDGKYYIKGEVIAQ